MSEITRKNLVVTFINGLGKEVNLTITKPIDDLGSEVISNIMEEIIASSALGEDALVATKKEAKYVIQEEEELEIF